MSNRFDQGTQQQYISTYVPKPLQYLSEIAKGMQNGYDKGVHATDDFSKLATAIKASPVGEGLKQDYINRFKKEREDLYNSTSSYSNPDFQKKAQELVTKYANDPVINTLAAEKALFDQTQKESTDPKNARNLNFTYGKFYDSNTGTYRQAKSLNELPLNSRITQYADAYKAQADIMGDIASSMSGGSKGYDFSHPQSGVGPGGEYYAFNKVTSKVEKVSPEMVKNIAQASLPLYAKTDAGMYELQKEAQKYIGERAYGMDYDKLTELARQDEGYKALKETIDQKFRNDLTGVGQKQIFTKATIDVDNMTLGDRQAADANDTKKVLDTLIPSTVEGKTMNALQGDTNAKGLVDQGVFSEESNIVKFDPTALGKVGSTYDIKFPDGTIKNVKSYAEAERIYNTTPGTSITPSKNKVSTKESQDAFNNQLIKMSSALGVDPKSLSIDGKLNTNKVSELATAYNQLTKVRSLDLSLAPAVQESETKNANLNWYQLKQVNPDKPEDTIDNTPLEENERVVVVNRRTDNKGKVYNEGYIENTKTKEIKPVAFRSHSVEKNLVFDALGKIQKISIDNLSTKDPQYMKDAKGNEVTNTVDTQYGKSNMKITGSENIGKGYYIQSLVDPHNKFNTLYVIKNPNNEVVEMKNSLGDLKKSVETFYFTQIPEGMTELENIKTKQKQSENQQNARQ